MFLKIDSKSIGLFGPVRSRVAEFDLLRSKALDASTSRLRKKPRSVRYDLPNARALSRSNKSSSDHGDPRRHHFHSSLTPPRPSERICGSIWFKPGRRKYD